MHGAIGLGLLVAMIAFAFGERAARTCVAVVLITMGLAFAYIMFRLITGTI